MNRRTTLETFCFSICVCVLYGTVYNSASDLMTLRTKHSVRHKRSTSYPESSDTQTAKEFTTIHFSCTGSHIRVTYARYYRGSRHCIATSEVQRRCNGRASCSFKSGNDICGDPSYGNIKLLQVDYSCMKACPSTISYCREHNCTSATNVWCVKCTDKDLYKLSDNNKRCLYQCSWLNRWCWPGHCSSDNFASDCLCDANFVQSTEPNTAKCQPRQKPEMLTCRMSVVAANNNTKQSVAFGSTACENQQDFYGNIQINHVISNMSADFVINITSAKPAFVGDHLFGVTDAYIDLLKIDKSGGEIFSIRKYLKQDFSGTNPTQTFHGHASINNKPVDGHLANGQRLCLRYQAKGGGFFRSRNVQTHQETTIPFDKTMASRTLCYYFDDQKPICCKEAGTCYDDPLQLSSRTTTNRTITVNISQWTDPIPSGGSSVQASKIESYIVTVYEMREEGLTHLNRDPTPIVAAQKVNKVADIHLPEKSPALYEISMEVKDVAENVRHVRRFVLHDNSSTIDIIPDRGLIVVSANKKTKYEWQTHLNDICVSWVGRYHNAEYQAVNLLKPIKHDVLYSSIYEQEIGILPVTGTAHIDGVTDFTYILYRNGNIAIPPHNLENISQSICLNTSKSDGDAFVFNLKICDIMNHSYIENVTVFLDSSVPNVNVTGIEQDGIRQLFVHNSTDLSRIVVPFNAYDRHSGLHDIMWLLQDEDGKSVIGMGSIGIKTLSINDTCSPNTHCYCPSVGPCEIYRHYVQMHSLVINDTHQGNHNRRYIISLKVTNNALLSVTEHIDILLDNSPPETGVVMEGPEDGPDIDYTGDSEIEVHWKGFIDHESGIKHYQVMAGPLCISGNGAEDNTSSNIFFNSNTTDTYITVPLRIGIKQYVTVIAYNNAMEASLPVCSVGIVFDNTPPMITNVFVDSAEIRELIPCFDNETWMINKSVREIQLREIPECVRICLNQSHNKLLKEMTNQNGSHGNFIFRCQKVSFSLFYILAGKITVKWSTDDSESQIENVKVGFGSSIATVGNPDIMEYEISENKGSFVKYHTGLSNSSLLYAFIKVHNKADLSTIATIGPISINDIHPECPDEMPAINHDGHVILQWSKDSFSDKEKYEENGNLFSQTATTTTTLAPSTVREDVLCETDSITIFIPEDLLPMGAQLTWLDQNCTLQSNSSHFLSTISHNQCGTSFTLTTDSVVFENKILVSMKSSISSLSNNNPNAMVDFGDVPAVIPVKCVYPRKQMSMLSYQPVPSAVRFYEKRAGNFEIKMEMYKTNQFRDALQNPPIRIQLQSDVNIRVTLNEHSGSFGLRLEKCIATTSPLPYDSNTYNLIENGCPVQSHVKILPSPPTEARFSMRAFEFVNNKSAQIYIHCEAALCQTGSPDCTPNCGNHQIRQKRDLTQNRHSHLISAGPLVLEADKGSDVQVSTVLAGVFAVVAFGAIILAAVGWRRKPLANRMDES